jgi:hypothetical protein
MRTTLVAAALLLTLAGCGDGSTPDAGSDQAAGTTSPTSGGTAGFPDCAALFKAGQPTPKPPAADTNGLSCSVSESVIDAVAGIRCKDESFIWSTHNKLIEGWGLAGDVWHAGEFHIDDPAYSAALGKCLS